MVVWCDVVWCDVVWCDVVWCCVVMWDDVMVAIVFFKVGLFLLFACLSV